VPALTYHELPHTHAHLATQGADPDHGGDQTLGQSNPAHTIATFQYVLTAMQAEAAATLEQLIRETRRS